MTTYKFCMEVEVTDEAELVTHALHRLIHNDGLSSDEANETVYPEGPGTDPSVEACLIAIFDPGRSPIGTQIHGSFTE